MILQTVRSNRVFSILSASDQVMQISTTVCSISIEMLQLSAFGPKSLACPHIILLPLIKVTLSIKPSPSRYPLPKKEHANLTKPETLTLQPWPCKHYNGGRAQFVHWRSAWWSTGQGLLRPLSWGWIQSHWKGAKQRNLYEGSAWFKTPVQKYITGPSRPNRSLHYHPPASSLILKDKHL